MVGLINRASNFFLAKVWGEGQQWPKMSVVSYSAQPPNFHRFFIWASTKHWSPGSRLLIKLMGKRKFTRNKNYEKDQFKFIKKSTYPRFPIWQTCHRFLTLLPSDYKCRFCIHKIKHRISSSRVFIFIRKLSNESNKEKHLWQRCKIQYLASLTWGVKVE